ncbi:MAG: crossover junction endodeoxyribonuclease RuvC [Dethiobacteria bacterium]|jgi:crossover junction endodeoxyribonuclease RuvC
MIVLGIDPGLATTGYGIVVKEGNQYYEKDYGYINTPAGMDLHQRLLIIFRSIGVLIDRYAPEAVAVEKLFFSKNTRTALQVGEARGAILTATAEKGLPVYEYTPLQVKQAVAGYGRADKKQVQQMVSILLRLAEPPRPDDAADALAVALCFLQSFKLEQLSRR